MKKPHDATTIMTPFETDTKNSNEFSGFFFSFLFHLTKSIVSLKKSKKKNTNSRSRRPMTFIEFNENLCWLFCLFHSFSSLQTFVRNVCAKQCCSFCFLFGSRKINAFSFFQKLSQIIAFCHFLTKY